MTPARFEAAMVAALRRGRGGGLVAVPAGGHMLWRWFGELNGARGWHANGPQPLTFAEIEAWARLNGWPLTARHVAVLRAMDAEWVRLWHADKGGTVDGAKVLRRGANQPLSPDLFDAAFG